VVERKIWREKGIERERDEGEGDLWGGEKERVDGVQGRDCERAIEGEGDYWGIERERE
jgi:hypothetical protein